MIFRSLMMVQLRILKGIYPNGSHIDTLKCRDTIVAHAPCWPDTKWRWRVQRSTPDTNRSNRNLVISPHNLPGINKTHPRRQQLIVRLSPPVVLVVIVSVQIDQQQNRSDQQQNGRDAVVDQFLKNTRTREEDPITDCPLSIDSPRDYSQTSSSRLGRQCSTRRRTPAIGTTCTPERWRPLTWRTEWMWAVTSWCHSGSRSGRLPQCPESTKMQETKHFFGLL